MNSKLIGDIKPHPEALQKMRDIGGNWSCFQNHDLGHHDLGHLKFLKYGKGCTFETPPDPLPDTQTEINWRYVFVGLVNLETGEIEEC